MYLTGPFKPASGARLLHTAFDYKRQPLSECMLAVIRLTDTDERAGIPAIRRL